MTHAFRFSDSEIAALIGTPWQAGATGPDAYDCWAAAGMVQERFFDRRLPGLGEDPRKTITRSRRSWMRCDTPRDGDIVEMRRMGRANHVGVWIRGGILHCQRGAGMVHDRPDTIRAMGWQMRIWTPCAPRPRKASGAAAVALYVPGLDMLLDSQATPADLLGAHRAVPLAATPGDLVSEVIARAGLDREHVAVFLRDNAAAPVPALPDDPAPEDVARLLGDLGAVLPAAWAETRIRPGQRLIVTQVPQGGGGSNPLRLVLQIAIMAAAAFFAPTLAPGLVSALGISSTAASGLAFGVLSFAGNFALNAVLPPPSPKAISSLSDEASPTFSARAQASIARPGAPIPVQFGRHIHQLDDISPPFVRFEENMQVVYQLLALGEGEHLLEEVRLGDTAVWRDGAVTGNLPGVSVEHILSGQPVTLMDEAVFTQGDVTGLTLAPDATIGWHSAVPAGKTAIAVEVEIARAHGRLGDLDLDHLLALHAAWSARGDRFDTVLDQRMSFWEVLQAALRAGRAQPDQLGRRIRIWRDEPQPIPRQLFSARNIRRGSLTIRPRLPVSERPERLVAQYMDERVWRPAEIAVGAITGRERRERYFGITNTDHLLREVQHDFRSARFRSVEVSFEAELENRLLLRGDPIALAHPELTSGVAVSIEAWQGLAISLGTLVEPFDTQDELLIRLTAPDGQTIGPFRVDLAAPGAPSGEVRVTEDEMTRLIADYGTDPRDWIARSRARDEAIRAVIGPASDLDMRLIVQDVGEERGGYATITCVDDDPRAQDFPVDSSGALDGLILDIAFAQEATSGGSMTTFTLALAPGGAPDGAMFDVGHSTDGGLTWVALGTTQLPQLEVARPEPVWDPGQLRAAVRVGGRRSAWFVRMFPGAGALPAPANFAEVTAGQWQAGEGIHVAADPVPGAASYRFDLRDSATGTMAILFRAAPELDLTVEALGTLNALSRDTVIRLSAVSPSAEPGAEAELVLPSVPPPGAATGFQLVRSVVTWEAGTPPPTHGWRVQWQGGETVLGSARFDRRDAGFRDPLIFAGLDAFGPGARVALQFAPDPYPDDFSP